MLSCLNAVLRWQAKKGKLKKYYSEWQACYAKYRKEGQAGTGMRCTVNKAQRAALEVEVGKVRQAERYVHMSSVRQVVVGKVW